jgi:hypothetical protein
MSKAAAVVFGLGLLPFLTGCESLRDHSLTGQLWNGDYVITHREPAINANIRLFDNPDHTDVLVLYTERRESNGATRPRAYFLLANRYIVEGLKQPRFENTNLCKTLDPVPFLAPGVAPPKTHPRAWGQLDEDAKRFTLNWDGKELGPFRLPSYPSKSSEVERLLLTPGTVLVDGTVAGVVIATFLAYCYAAGRG